MSDRPAAGPTLGTGRRWRRRILLHHLPLAAASGVVLVLFMTLAPFTNTGSPALNMGSSSPLPASIERMGARRWPSLLTTATGYVAVGLLALTLLIGPANLLLRRRNPVSSYLRRDVGTWTAVFSIAHVVVGLQVHGRGTISGVVNYFVDPDGMPMLNSFGLANWTGLAALVIVTGLLALSTEGSLRELKARRWKYLQRFNYALFALVILHAFFYGALLRTTSPFTIVGLITVSAVVIGQAVGFRLWRQRHAHLP